MNTTAATVAYDNEQRAGIDLCCDLSLRVVCITGQAGTGKTTLLRGAVEQIVDQLGYDPENSNIDSAREPPFALAAPTGRAAKRIEEATTYPAKTIHRLLRFSVPEDDKDFGLPAHTRNNPMPYDVVFCDEASMIAPQLRRSLIDAIKKGAAVRFFGDINQLPPIMTDKEKAELDGIISPFAKDLKRFPSITLTKNYRSTDGIISVADRVINNRMPTANEQVRILRRPSVDATTAVMKLAEEIDFTHPDNQIICPANTTKHGTINLNRLIQQKFNSNTDKINVYYTDYDGKTQVRSFKVGDKIIWDKNDYNIGLMNGTIGTVLGFDEESGDIAITADNRDYTIPAQMEAFNPITQSPYFYDPRKSMLLGYAISTHKAQGSQFRRVCYVLSRSRVATRQNLYTAITRAQESLVIFDIASALNGALMNSEGGS